MRVSNSRSSSLTSSLLRLGFWFWNVPVCDTLSGRAVGCTRRQYRLEQQVICGGFPFLLRLIMVDRRWGKSNFDFEQLSSTYSLYSSMICLIFGFVESSILVEEDCQASRLL